MNKNMDDIEFKKRVRVSINKVVYERNLTNKTLAPFLNTTPTTLSNYRTMKNMPKALFITKFCKVFECNREWFLTGKGRPFFDSGDDYPELINKYFKVSVVRARKIPKVHDPDSWVSTYNNIVPPPIQRHIDVCGPEITVNMGWDAQKINFDEAIRKMYKVLSSGTPYAVALYLNIQQFSAALDYGEELAALKDQVAELRRQIDRH